MDGVVNRGRKIKEPSSEHAGVADNEAIILDDMDTVYPVQAPHLSREDEPDLEQGNIASESSTKVNGIEDSGDHIRFGSLPDQHASPRRQLTRLFPGAGVGVSDLDRHPRHIGSNLSAYTVREAAGPRNELNKLDKYLTSVSNGLIGRNSQFHNLTAKEREELGGLEYQAVTFLAWVVPAYFILWQLIAAIGCGAYIKLNRPQVAGENGLNPWWTGAFFAVSAFNNSGMALLDANMTAFQTSYYMILTLGLLILAGNTCYPPFLRLIIWSIKKCLPSTWQERRKVLDFILDHPRRVYTHLFPAQETWYLVGTLVFLNGIDWFA